MAASSSINLYNTPVTDAGTLLTSVEQETDAKLKELERLQEER
jgi:hypothetical protein